MERPIEELYDEFTADRDALDEHFAQLGPQNQTQFLRQLLYEAEARYERREEEDDLLEYLRQHARRLDCHTFLAQDEELSILQATTQVLRPHQQPQPPLPSQSSQASQDVRSLTSRAQHREGLLWRIKRHPSWGAFPGCLPPWMHINNKGRSTIGQHMLKRWGWIARRCSLEDAVTFLQAASGGRRVTEKHLRTLHQRLDDSSSGRASRREDDKPSSGQALRENHVRPVEESLVPSSPPPMDIHDDAAPWAALRAATASAPEPLRPVSQPVAPRPGSPPTQNAADSSSPFPSMSEDFLFDDDIPLPSLSTRESQILGSDAEDMLSSDYFDFSCSSVLGSDISESAMVAPPPMDYLLTPPATSAASTSDSSSSGPYGSGPPSSPPSTVSDVSASPSAYRSDVSLASKDLRELPTAHIRLSPDGLDLYWHPKMKRSEMVASE